MKGHARSLVAIGVVTALALGVSTNAIAAGACSFKDRAIKREISGSGTYINLSHGAFAPSPQVMKPSMAGVTREKQGIRTKINQQSNF